jgi:hypothetical protein
MQIYGEPGCNRPSAWLIMSDRIPEHGGGQDGPPGSEADSEGTTMAATGSGSAHELVIPREYLPDRASSPPRRDRHPATIPLARPGEARPLADRYLVVEGVEVRTTTFGPGGRAEAERLARRWGEGSAELFASGDQTVLIRLGRPTPAPGGPPAGAPRRPAR